jgi:hypothetical protein
MKSILLTPRASVREVLSPLDAERMLRSGSWMKAVVPKPVSAGAKRQRAFLDRRRQAGFHRLDIYLPPRVFAALLSRRKPGESMASLIERLISSTCDAGEKV